MFSNYPFRICQNIPNNISILMFLLRAHIDIYWYTFTSAYTCGKCYFPKQKYAQSKRINLNVVTKQMNETSAPSREHFFCLLTTEQHLSKKFEPNFCVAFEWSFFWKLWNQLEYFRIRNSHENPSSSLLRKKDTIAREWSYPFECIKTLLRTCPIILICDRWNFHDLQTKINKCMAQHDDDGKRFISLCSNELISNVWQSSKSIEISIKFIRSFFINSWKPLTTDKNYTNIIVLCDWLIQRLDLIFYFFTREIII